MWQKSHSIISRSVTKEQMWKLFSDIDNWHTWDAGVVSASLESEFAAGNYFRFEPKGGPKLRLQILEAEKNRIFTDLTRFPLAKMTGRHTFEETSGGLKITTTMTVEWILWFLWVLLVAKGIADALPADMAHQVTIASQL